MVSGLTFRFLIHFLKILFICFERERERVHTSMSRGGAEWETVRIPSRLLTVSTEPNAGLELTNREIMI